MYHSKDEEKLINQKHHKVRGKLRFFGPLILIIGLILVGVGAWSIITGTVFEHEILGFGMFVGMFLIFIGSSSSMFGFMGSVARYQAGEVLPVMKDSVNYMADGTKGSVKTMAKALGEGLSEGFNPTPTTSADQVTCGHCKTENDPDARFCDNCGNSLRNECPKCNNLNDPDAKFCDECGKSLR